MVTCSCNRPICPATCWPSAPPSSGAPFRVSPAACLPLLPWSRPPPACPQGSWPCCWHGCWKALAIRPDPQGTGCSSPARPSAPWGGLRHLVSGAAGRGSAPHRRARLPHALCWSTLLLVWLNGEGAHPAPSLLAGAHHGRRPARPAGEKPKSTGAGTATVIKNAIRPD